MTLIVPNLPLMAKYSWCKFSALKDGKGVSETDLADYPLVIIKSSDRQSPDADMDDVAKWYVTDQTTKKILITSGLGWGRLPRHLIEKELKNDELICLTNQGDLTLPIYISKLKNRIMGPVALKIWDHFL
mgnify:CR=1 FL=1